MKMCPELKIVELYVFQIAFYASSLVIFLSFIYTINFTDEYKLRNLITFVLCSIFLFMPLTK
jgi:hypothetical protein